MSNTSQGALGEQIAAQFLTKLGFRIIDRNFTMRGGEIDLIALHRGILVFVEVKTRANLYFGSPESAVTPAKLRFIERTAIYYKHTHTGLPGAMRIDVVAILLQNGKTPEITHLKNVTG